MPEWHSSSKASADEETVVSRVIMTSSASASTNATSTDAGNTHAQEEDPPVIQHLHSGIRQVRESVSQKRAERRAETSEDGGLASASSLMWVNRTISVVSVRGPQVAEENDEQDEHFFPTTYRIPALVVRRAMQRLDFEHPGELRSTVVCDALKTFDETFGVRRSKMERMQVVDELEFSRNDFSRVKWNAKPLFDAFSVRLTWWERFFFIADVGDTSTTLSWSTSCFMILAIILSIGVWMAGTIPACTRMPCEGCEPVPLQWMQDVDETCVILFTSEFLLRFFTAPMVRAKLLRPRFLVDLLSTRRDAVEAQDHPHPGLENGVERMQNLWAFLKQPTVLIDICTILPYWLEVAFDTETGNFIWLRLFRLLRVSRVFKLVQLLNSDLGKLGDAKHLLLNVCAQASPAFAITGFLLAFALLVFSAFMHTFERGDWYPRHVFLENSESQYLAEIVLDWDAVKHHAEKNDGIFLRRMDNGFILRSPFESIPSAFWWTLATITTVGYGDNIPVTMAGKVAGAMAILYGAILLGLPIGIIGSQFSMEFGRVVNVGRKRAEKLKERQAARGGPEMQITPNSTGDSQHLSSNPPMAVRRTASGRRTSSRADNFRKTMSTTLEHWKHKLAHRSESHGKEARGKAHDAYLRLQKLPISVKQREQLLQAKYTFEDLLQIHGETLAISAELQQSWSDELWQTQFCGGPALDRLSVRVLSAICDGELRQRNGQQGQFVRLAWFDLVLGCCSISQIVAEMHQQEKLMAQEEEEEDEEAEEDTFHLRGAQLRPDLPEEKQPDSDSVIPQEFAIGSRIKL